MCKPTNDLTHDITVKVNPCHSTFPMLMVSMDNAKPWDLCTIKAHAFLSKICFLFPHFMGGIGTFFGWYGPMVDDICIEIHNNICWQVQGPDPFV
jgi:hypothetical protein